MAIRIKFISSVIVFFIAMKYGRYEKNAHLLSIQRRALTIQIATFVCVLYGYD
jgi:hypothetical protein